MMNDKQKANKGEILVVDDSYVNLKLLQNLLTSQGYKIRPASDGRQALTAVAMRAPDLILLDIRMPGIDGYEVCRQLKADEKSRAIPVIFISALDTLAERVKGFATGGVDYITKPFYREEVLVRVDTHLQLYRMQKNLERMVEERTLEVRRIHGRLEKSEEKFRTIFESSNDGIVLLDDRGFFDCNEAALKIFGFENREEFLGRHPAELSPAMQPDGRYSREAMAEEIATAYRKGQNFFEWTHIRRNGEEFSVEMLLTPLRLDERIVLQATIRDITRRRLRQERIVHLAQLRKIGLEVHRRLTTIRDIPHLLQDICDIFVAEPSYHCAWIGLLDEEQKCILMVNSGLQQDFSLLEKEVAKGLLPPCLKKILDDRQFVWQSCKQFFCIECPVVNDYADSAIMGVPFQYEERLYGGFVVSLDKENIVNMADHRELFQELGRSIAFVLNNSDQDGKRYVHEQEIFFRDQISQTFILHRDNNLYEKMMDIILEAMESKSGLFCYLKGADMLICPSMINTPGQKYRKANELIRVPSRSWDRVWHKVLENGETYCSNAPLKVFEDHLAMENCMAAAIVSGDQVIGLLQVFNKDNGYDKQGKKLLESLAATIAPILKARFEQQRAEQELQSAIEEYADLYNNVPVMFASVEIANTNSVEIATTKVIRCNQNLLDTLGYSKEEIIGHSSFNLYHPDCLAEVKNSVFPTFCRTGVIKNRELILQRQDGSSLPVILNVSAVRDKDGKILQSRSAWHDITDRKRLEEQLLISEKMTTIAGLAAGVAHEINSPLSGILQAVQLIEMGLDPEQKQNLSPATACGLNLVKVQDYMQQKELDFFLNGIKESATTAASIVSDLLQFSRPHASNPVSVNLIELIDRTVSLAKVDYQLKKEFNIINVEFIYEYTLDLQEIICLPMEIEQVLINLIKNSCQAMAEEGGPAAPHIILRTKRRGEMAVIEVEDNGPGMEKETRHHIFDPFFTTKDVGQGTGLGLAVCYSIISDKHGGTIHVESIPGKWAKFIIAIPIKGYGESSHG